MIKTPAKTDNTAMLERRIRAEVDAEPARAIERYERYRRMLRSGASEATFEVIANAAKDSHADWALREYIAEKIDMGREGELNAQLRAYAIMYLVHPGEIMRRREP